jgi:hypothetical protein
MVGGGLHGSCRIKKTPPHHVARIESLQKNARGYDDSSCSTCASVYRQGKLQNEFVALKSSAKGGFAGSNENCIPKALSPNGAWGASPQDPRDL